MTGIVSACSGAGNPARNDDDSSKTDGHGIKSTYLSEVNGSYILTLPECGEAIELDEEMLRFLPYISDTLVREAEKKLTQEIAEDTNKSGFYCDIGSDNYLYLSVEVIRYTDVPVDTGCGDHEHIFYQEKISDIEVVEELQFGTSDSDYAKIQFFPDVIPEFQEGDYDEETFITAMVSETDMELLRRIYNDRGRWTNDSIVDRVLFYFNGRIKFATMETSGWMYFGVSQNMLYYNGYYTELSEKERYLLIQSYEPDEYFSISSDGSAVTYRSGENEIKALSSLLWTKLDNGDGTFTTEHGVGIREYLPTEDVLAQIWLPELVLDGTLEAFVPVNGRVAGVYLLDMKDRVNYPKTETSWEEIAELPEGQYFIVVQTILSGNCDPDALQNTYCYEDLFVLFVEDSEKIPENDQTLLLDEPLANKTYSYGTYEKLYCELTAPYEENPLVLEQEEFGVTYCDMLMAMAYGKTELCVPQVNGINLPLRSSGGAEITLFTNELYNLPWIWYQCLFDEKYEITVKLSYIASIGLNDAYSMTDFCKLQKIIAPDAPSPDNYKEYDAYSVIYQQELELGDGSIVMAMMSELKDSSKIYVSICQNGMLVSLYGEKEVFTKEFWRSFAMTPYVN